MIDLDKRLDGLRARVAARSSAAETLAEVYRAKLLSDAVDRADRAMHLVALLERSGGYGENGITTGSATLEARDVIDSIEAALGAVDDAGLHRAMRLV